MKGLVFQNQFIFGRPVLSYVLPGMSISYLSIIIVPYLDPFNSLCPDEAIWRPRT